jgi:cobalamin transport system permease protein
VTRPSTPAGRQPPTDAGRPPRDARADDPAGEKRAASGLGSLVRTAGPEPAAPKGPASRWRRARVVGGGNLRPAGLRPGWLAVALGLLLIALLVGLAVGAARLTPAAVAGDLLDRLLGRPSALTERQQAILWQLRAPRVAIGAVVGATLALAGAAYQGVFGNPLADPYLLGVSAGAGLGATLAVAGGLPGVAAGTGLLPVAAFAGAVLAVAATYLLGRSVGGRGTTSLILAGVAVAAFCISVQSYIQQRHQETIRQVYSWLLGDLSTVGWRELAGVAPYVLVGGIVVLAHRRLLDVLRLGDEEARSLGVNTSRVRLLVVVAATVATAAAVAVSGLIGFVGIVVPHAVRMVVGGANAALLPLSALLGAAFLVLADVAARTVAMPAEVPIGVVTALVGAPFFALVLRLRRGELS